MPPKLVFRQIVQIYILGFLIYFLSYYNVLKKKKKKKLYCSQSLIVNVSAFGTVTKLEEFGSKIDFQEVFSFP